MYESNPRPDSGSGSPPPPAPVYLETPAVGPALAACAKSYGDGHLRANFLNPFALEATDSARHALLEPFEFVGSMASRHRLISQIERDNYPGEAWVMLEIWVLKRKK